MLPNGLLKEYSNALAVVLRVTDIFAVIVAGLVAYYLKFDSLYVTENYIFALVISAILTLVVFSVFNLYDSVRSRSITKYLYQLIQALSVVLFILAGLAFLTKTGETFSRGWFLTWGLLIFILLVSFRCSVLLLLRIMRANGMNERRVIIVGAGAQTEKLVNNIHHALWTGFRIVKIFSEKSSNFKPEIGGVKVNVQPKDIGVYIDSLNYTVDELWLCLPLDCEDKVKLLLLQLNNHTIAVRFVLDIFGLDIKNHTFSDLAGVPALNLSSSPMIGIKSIVKMLEDKLLAFFIILLISPLFVLISILIKATSKGPIIFKQRRHGWDGKVINVYKFRTMFKHDEAFGVITQASQNDPRVTPLGKFLRKTSLDELPQFYNVLQGKMSIVGPRPHAIEHNDFYKKSIKAYMQRHKMKPGITGWAQVNGWRGRTDKIEKMEGRVEHDLYYIENWTLWFDLKIIFLTVIYGFFNKNAY